ncbi:NUDIX domain-containing protein [Biscogniauxia sp. FL1348]|nr:NUDIX domain-containing protein [Biscogniauxia sp. FL1348]
MAACRWKRTLYGSDQFVEACGAVVFSSHTSSDSRNDMSVCLLYHGDAGEWLLPKGRRNCGETRPAAALREVREETGCTVVLAPLRMPTRAPHPAEPPDVPDAAREYGGLTEPFMLDLVWWFVARLQGVVGPAEDQFEVRFVDCGEAVALLTFQNDRDVLTRAIEVMGRQEDALGAREGINGDGAGRRDLGDG